MAEAEMHPRRFHAHPDRLRSPERMARLEIDRVVGLSIEGLAPRSMIDIGTGTGVFAEAFEGIGLEVAGIDTSAEMLTIARSYVSSAKFVEAAAEAVPYPDRSFDLVFLGHLLHEADDPLKALKEARRLARMRVIVLEWPYREEEHGPPLKDRLSPDVIQGLTSQAGFHISERIGLMHMDLYRLTV
ncbi:MAG: methyltransferase domain-containing protein [Dehalococcoidia bacterium]|nr:methyltransferase domain-containing protein [Dehalococcoidia bacterium]